MGDVTVDFTVDEKIKDHHNDCMAYVGREFMSQRSYYKAIVAGIIVMLGFAGGSLGWAFATSSDVSIVKENIKVHGVRLNSLESRLDRQHEDVMAGLREIERKIGK